MSEPTKNKYRDFDAAWAEKAEAEGSPQPLTFKLKGRDWQLPASIPAAVIIRILRMQKRDADDPVPDDEQMEMALSLFGKDQLDELLDTGLSTDELGDVILWAMGEYGLATVPNRRARRTKKDGQTKKRKKASIS